MADQGHDGRRRQEEEAAVPLLANKAGGGAPYYVDGCPGCAVDRRKAANPGIPYGSFIYVWVVVLCTAIPISSLFPFLYFMIRDLHIAERTEDIGFYAGFVGAAFMLGRCLTSTVWGIAADRIGRKPVVMFGVFSVLVTFFLLFTYYQCTSQLHVLCTLKTGRTILPNFDANSITEHHVLKICRALM